MITNETINNTLLIYTPLITSRLKYIFDFILVQELGVNYNLCTVISEIEQSNQQKFSYALENYFPDMPFIKSEGLLQSTDIHKVNLNIFTFQNHKAFFKTEVSSFFPFDIFSASFYLISRYEEYLPFKADKHGRFQAEQSAAYRHGFLETPLINFWINSFKTSLLKVFPTLVFKSQPFKFLSTIDIDNAYADLNKGKLRTFLSLLKLLISFKLKPLNEKLKVLNHKIKDKYDNFEYLNQIHEKYKIDPIYFILFSKYGKFDKNLPINNKAFKNLIEKIANKYEIGLHPSYQSNKSFEILKKEKQELEKITNIPITKSRQHFLKLNLPLAYQNLIKLDIEKDFSMGYSSTPGFRASVCSPFRFFNLETNQETKLEIIPFAVMDSTFIHYLQASDENTIKKIKKIIKSVREVNGLFVSLWHNETLYQSKSQFDWRNVFEQMLYEVEHGNSL